MRRQERIRLFLVLACTMLAATVQSAGAEKDANGTAVVSELVTTFHLDHKQKAQYAVTFPTPNGGVIKCTSVTHLLNPCEVWGSGYSNTTHLITPESSWLWFTYPCGSGWCVTTDWKISAYAPTIEPTGTTTVYTFQSGNMTACLADGTECAIPNNKWNTGDGSPGIIIQNVPMYVPLVIHANYNYKSGDGKTLTMAVDQYLFKGYGW